MTLLAFLAFEMIIYRKNPLPAIYCKIPFWRRITRVFADCPDDLNEIILLKEISKGNLCISKLEQQNTFLLAISFSEELLHLKGDTDELIEYVQYGLKMWDVGYYLRGTKPTEGVDPFEVGLDSENIENIAAKSCLPFIHKLEKAYGKQSEPFLTKEEEKKIVELEERAFARIKLKSLKGSLNSSFTECYDSSNTKMRGRILRRDLYKCVFCGTHGNETKLDVDHIIPKNTIKKLNLNEILLSIDYNLVTNCFKCNRSKSDYLKKQDIEYYFKAFANPEHPNHKILDFLKPIKSMQGL